MKRKAKRIGAALTALAIVGMCGCAHRSEVAHETKAEITFSWCGDDEIHKGTLEGIRAFNDSTDITVVPEYSEPGVYNDTLISLMSADMQADVIEISYEMFYQYSADGDRFYNIYELTDNIDFSTYPTGTLTCGIVNGNLYGVPYNFNSLCFVYNKTLYDQYGLDIPTSWDDLFNAAEVMGKDGIYPIALSEEGLWICCCAYFEQTTGKKIFKDRMIDLQAQDYEVMINFYRKLMDKNVTKPGYYFDKNEFEKGSAAGVACWASDTGFYEEAGRRMNSQAVLGTPLMTQKPLASGWYRKPSGLYAISKKTASPDEAAEFLNYLINSSEMTVYTGLARGVPISRSAMETLEARNMLSGLEVEANRRSADIFSVDMMSPFFEDEAIISEFIDICESVLYGKTTANSAAYTAKKHIDDIMEKLI